MSESNKTQSSSEGDKTALESSLVEQLVRAVMEESGNVWWLSGGQSASQAFSLRRRVGLAPV